ncbi:Gfo/Idh/MocA family protein [Paenibacillus ginsengarvi]|uniref:Gfo/Idh/MocA family oxidoreductase n=1 Tax=Paenibacillus ginsengarvi TaxID=400777 RepID=A0A3B0CMK7_9BACL|nr:Gfo/Idh/MocA family oxidoreductase [Paenibacillus ginsengarvi]RKN86412.1 gfo/Idh/MocA family oxidoreductase [Paenibacillus ginsengarvi]
MAMRFGIYGCQHGHIAAFIGEMTALGAECAGIYDREENALAKRLSEQYGIPLLRSAEVLQDDSIPIIGSSAINREKIDVIEWCERHGKHIMLDKPIVTSRSGLERLEQVFARGHIQIGMLLTERFRPAIAALKQTIESGRLGRIVSITMRKPHKLSPASRHAWHFSKEQNGGLMIDLFVHDFDLLRWLTGQEIASIQSLLAKNILPEYPSFYDTACAQVLLTGGTMAQLYTDWHTPDKSWTWGDGRLFVTGTSGAAELRLSGDPSCGTNEELFFQITHDEPFVRVETTALSSTVTGDFIDRIQGKHSILTHHDILQTCRASVEADEKATIINTVKDKCY